MWEGKPLRSITEADVRQLVTSGLEEHLQLEYKSALYDNSDRDARESLLDTCMFANAGGGILLIGVPEKRDGQLQPTGAPDPDAPLGINVPNPEQVLLAHDARVVACIEDRLPIESASIPVGDGAHVLAIRVPNSTARPHCVRHQGRVYFPSRRERHRYEMDVREIKEMVMRTASRLEEAEHKLQDAFLSMPRTNDAPHLLVGCIPVFWRNFSVDPSDPRVREAVAKFSLVAPTDYRQPSYNFRGLERVVYDKLSTVQVHRDGLVVLNRRIELGKLEQDIVRFYPVAIDRFLQLFLIRVVDVHAAARLNGPYLIGMMLRIGGRITAAYGGMLPGLWDDAGSVPAGDYSFPVVQADDLSQIDKIVRPLCDQAHQMFGRESSPYFDREGIWIGPKT